MFAWVMRTRISSPDKSHTPLKVLGTGTFLPSFSIITGCPWTISTPDARYSPLSKKEIVEAEPAISGAVLVVHLPTILDRSVSSATGAGAGLVGREFSEHPHGTPKATARNPNCKVERAMSHPLSPNY